MDGQEAVVGGINIGNVYSHRNTEEKWRDTDVLVQGPAVTDSERMFADVWNAHAEKNGYASMEKPAEPAAVSGGMSAAVVNHNPGPDGDSHIMLSMIKAIEGATESVDMEQAYFINTPGVKDALMKALDAGVKVRILTNSAESIDEAIMAYPILARLLLVLSRQRGRTKHLAAALFYPPSALALAAAVTASPMLCTTTLEASVPFCRRLELTAPRSLTSTTHG